MINYQLEIQQLVTYPRCRIYRPFIRQLTRDPMLRVNRTSYLYFFTVLCSYANYRASYRRIEDDTYTVFPGQWVCSLSNLFMWFHSHSKKEILSILDWLRDNNFITYTYLERKKVVQYEITGWDEFNTIIEDNFPCKKDSGFFFFPIAKISGLIGSAKCSELDIVLDLWMHTVYNDDRVEGSQAGPVVYYRNGTGSPLTSYAALSNRWGISKASVSRVMKKLEQCSYVSLIHFPGQVGSAIYIQNYLSTMFDISDVMLDKEEIAMHLHVNVKVPQNANDYLEILPVELVPEDQITDSANSTSVSKMEARFLISKVAKILATQGLSSCFHCKEAHYYLLNLSDCRKLSLRYRLEILCPGNGSKYQFEMTVKSLGMNQHDQ